jgi:hypothetical protein
MSELCTCGSNWTDEYCPNHGRYPPGKREVHALEARLRKMSYAAPQTSTYDALKRENEALKQRVEKLSEALRGFLNAGDRDALWANNWSELYCKARDVLAKTEGQK